MVIEEQREKKDSKEERKEAQIKLMDEVKHAR